MRVWLRGCSIRGRFQLRPVAGQRREYKPEIKRVEAQLQHAALQSWSQAGQAPRTWALETWGITVGWVVSGVQGGAWGRPTQVGGNQPLATLLC